MDNTHPTVQQILDQSAIGCGLHQWRTDDGGMVQVSAADLREALEKAYDPNDRDWTRWVGLDDDGFYFCG